MTLKGDFMAHTVVYYLSKGFDKKMAAYFASGRKKLIKIEPNTDFTLNLTYEGDEKRLYDIKPLLKRNTVFETFLDYNKFKKVYIDNSNNICWDKDPEKNSDIEWNNKVDISADTAYIDSTPIKKDSKNCNF